MRYADKMDRPLSDDDRRWLRENNLGHVADEFDREDGVDQEEDAEPDDSPEPRDYSKMTVPDLMAEIDRRNGEILADDPDASPIPTDGKKADLIQRLKEDDEAMAASE